MKLNRKTPFISISSRRSSSTSVFVRTRRTANGSIYQAALASFAAHGPTDVVLAERRRTTSSTARARARGRFSFSFFIPGVYCLLSIPSSSTYTVALSLACLGAQLFDTFRKANVSLFLSGSHRSMPVRLSTPKTDQNQHLEVSFRGTGLAENDYLT